MQDAENGGSFFQVGGGSGGGGGGGNKTAGTVVGQAGPSLLSEETLFLHSLSAPALSGVGACDGAGTFRSGGGLSGGDGVSSIGSRSVLSKAEGEVAPGRRMEGLARVALPPLAS